MATFSENQVRQLFVAKSSGAVSTGNPVGKIHFIGNGEANASTAIHGEYMGFGGIVGTGVIDVNKIVSIKCTTADKMALPMARYKVSLDGAVNQGKPVVGQDYVLSITARGYLGLGSENTYTKVVDVKATSAMSNKPELLYKEIALAAAKIVKQDTTVKVYLETSGTQADALGAAALDEVTAATVPSTLSKTYTGVVFEEKPQEWQLGIGQQRGIELVIVPGTINTQDDGEVVWGHSYKVAPNSQNPVKAIVNSHLAADLEYFCMGERADLYRGVGFPNTITTKYVVDPELADGYDALDIVYYYSGDNEDVQKSQKTLTILAPATTSHAVIKAVIDEINALIPASMEIAKPL